MKHIIELKCEQMVSMCESQSGYGSWDNLSDGQKHFFKKFAEQVKAYVREKENDGQRDKK